MKGLILKDIIAAKKQFSSFLIIIVIFSIITLLTDNVFFSSFIVLFGGIMPVSLISYDDKSRWNSYCDTLPCSRKDVISSKYIFTLILNFSLTLLMTVLLSVKSAGTQTFDFTSIIISSLVILSGSFVFPSVMLPIIIKFGVEKARIIYTAATIVTVAAAAPLSSFALLNLEAEIPEHFQNSMIITALIIFAVSALLLFFSWLISVKIYNGKEF